MTRRSRIIPVILVTAATVASVLAGWAFVRWALHGFDPVTACVDRFDETVSYGNSATFRACLKDHSETFLRIDYAESKDLAKAFLTLLTAMLVASVTFSEKVISFATASWWSKWLMISTWLCLLLAIVTCGVALTLMAMGASLAANAPNYDYMSVENPAGVLFVSSGLLFGVALAALLTSGIVSLLRPTLVD